MFCTQCGNSIDEKANFCPNCGARTASAGPVLQEDPRREKKLLRPREDKWIAGVCGAFANYFQVDLTLVRLLWAASIILAGTGLLVYLLCWIIIPREPIYVSERTQTFSA